MDETNLETHGSWQKLGACSPEWNVPGSYPEWRQVVIDRAVSMFERDKNHPSILWWSCGNESYAGECILAMGDYFRRKDSSRVVHYEGSFWNREFNNISDVESQMYPTPTSICEFLDKDTSKPFILCEYMHDMGNSLGGMESYINLLDKYPQYQGGFIWDYMDQALYQEINGEEVLCYGGDFSDRPSDYNFSGNGIVFADRTEKPAMQEVRFWFSTPEERKAHLVKNEEKQKELKPVAPAPSTNLIEVLQGDCNLGVKGEGFHVIFSYQDPGIVSLKYGEQEWMYRASKPTYWRALTENDAANGFTRKSGSWHSANLYQYATDIKVDTETENQVSITYVYDTTNGGINTTTYTVYADGIIKVSSTLKGDKNLPQLPAFGMRFMLNEEVTTVEYDGLSGETYPDRFKGGFFDTHKEEIHMTDYLVPQECNNHMNTQRLTLIGSDKNKLNITMDDSPFHFSLLPNTCEELELAKHKYELPAYGRSTLNILSHMRGVGGIDTWGCDVEDAYHLIPEEDMTVSFYIHP